MHGITRRARRSRRPYLPLTAERERISLGIKQLEKDPFSAWLAEHPKNTIVKGTVTEVDAAQAHLIDLGDGVDRLAARVGDGARPS